MIGNDLVAFEACRLYSPERWTAYWRKILVESELAEFDFHANDPRAWVYWAAKEAAWKIWFRRSAKRLLNPKAFVLQKVDWDAQKVTIQVQGPERTYTGSVEINEKYLHVLLQEQAFGEAASPIGYHVCAKDRLTASINEDPFLKTFSSANASYIGSKIHSKQQFSLSRDNLGIPSLEFDGNVLDLPITLSHHGSWAAYAYVYPQRTQP